MFTGGPLAFLISIAYLFLWQQSLCPLRRAAKCFWKFLKLSLHTEETPEVTCPMLGFLYEKIWQTTFFIHLISRTPSDRVKALALLGSAGVKRSGPSVKALGSSPAPCSTLQSAKQKGVNESYFIALQEGVQ